MVTGDEKINSYNIKCNKLWIQEKNKPLLNYLPCLQKYFLLITSDAIHCHSNISKYKRKGDISFSFPQLDLVIRHISHSLHRHSPGT